MEMNRYQAGIDDFTDSESIVFGISTDELAQNKKFAQELGLAFQLLSDEDGSVAKSYGVLMDGRTMAMRQTFVVDKEGKIAHISTGAEAMDPMKAASACKGLN